MSGRRALRELGHKRSGRPSRRAFTLLEVLLALAILLGSIVVLGELTRQGLRQAAGARDHTRALLLCDSLLAEIAAGIQPTEPREAVPVPEQPEWLATVERRPTATLGLIEIQVTVRQDLPAKRRPVEATLVRWVHVPERRAMAITVDPADQAPPTEPRP